MSYENPPGDAKPDRLLKLCQTLREGEADVDGLVDDIEMSEPLVRDTLKYGNRMGLIQKKRTVPIP